MSTGIIGGADGPTKIFVSSGMSFSMIVAIVIGCIAVCAIVIWAVKR